MKFEGISKRSFFLLLPLSLLTYGGLSYGQNSSGDCQVTDRSQLSPEVKILLEPICDRSKDVKKLVKVKKESSVDFSINMEKLNNGQVQLSTELMGPSEFKKHSLKVLDKEGFTDKGVILVSKIAFLLPKKQDSFYSLAHQTDVNFLESCLYKTKINLTDDKSKEDHLKGIVPLIKTVKIDKVPGVMDSLEDPVGMEAKISVHHYDKALSEGPLSDSQSSGHGDLKDLRELSKSEDKLKSEPSKVVVMELGKADRAIYGSRIFNEHYSLGDKDGRTLVVIRQILSLNITLPKHEKITKMINDLLQNDFGVLNPKRIVQNLIKSKIIDRTNYESGMSIETMRADGIK